MHYSHDLFQNMAIVLLSLLKNVRWHRYRARKLLLTANYQSVQHIHVKVLHHQAPSQASSVSMNVPQWPRLHHTFSDITSPVSLLFLPVDTLKHFSLCVGEHMASLGWWERWWVTRSMKAKTLSTCLESPEWDEKLSWDHFTQIRDICVSNLNLSHHLLSTHTHRGSSGEHMHFNIALPLSVVNCINPNRLLLRRKFTSFIYCKCLWL